MESLQMIREAQGLTQVQLAEVLNIEVGTISRWERGKTRPTRAIRQPYAKALGVSAEKLAGILNGVCGKSL